MNYTISSNWAVGQMPTDDEVRRGADALRRYYRKTPRAAITAEAAVRAVLLGVRSPSDVAHYTLTDLRQEIVRALGDCATAPRGYLADGVLDVLRTFLTDQETLERAAYPIYVGSTLKPWTSPPTPEHKAPTAITQEQAVNLAAAAFGCAFGWDLRRNPTEGTHE